MVYEERNTWSSLIGTIVALTAYVIIVLQQAGGGPLADVNWWPIMLGTIVGSIVLTIVISIAWGMAAGIVDPEGIGQSDARDRDIARMGDRAGQAFMVIAGLGVLVLCAFESDWFWIANTMFFGFAISHLVASSARVVAYRRGLA